MGQAKLGINNETVVKAVGAFGGGIAATGGTCGILLGGVALISSVCSRGNLDEKEDLRMWTLSKKFVAQFEEMTRELGGTDCRNIARVDWSDKVAAKEYYLNPLSRRAICIKLVGDAACALGVLLEQDAVK